MKNKLLTPLRVLVVSLALLLSTVQAQPATDISINTGSQSVSLSQFHGQVIYLDFWASWCIPCRESFPWMSRMQQKYADKGFKVIAINLDEEKSNADRFLQKYPASFIVGFDPSGKSAELYQVKGMPSSYLIDRQGRIISSHVGFRQKDIEKLESAIQSVLTQSLRK